MVFGHNTMHYHLIPFNIIGTSNGILNGKSKTFITIDTRMVFSHDTIQYYPVPLRLLMIKNTSNGISNSKSKYFSLPLKHWEFEWHTIDGFLSG